MQGIILSIAVLLLIGAFILQQVRKRRHQLVYGRIPHFQRRDSLLNRFERAYYNILIETVGQHALIFPKVRLTDLLSPPSYNPQFRPHWQRVQRRCVDFVLCTRSSMSPVLAIKLESRSERKKREQQGVDILDDALEVAGIPLIRVRAMDSYDTVAVVKEVRAALAGGRGQVVDDVVEEDQPEAEGATMRHSLWARFVQKQLPTFSRWTSSLWFATRRRTMA